MACRLILIRHGESALGAEHRYAGHSNTPLTSKGRLQVVRLRRRFARYRVHQIYSSDLPRCRETAEILVPGRDIIISRRLRELDFGAWEGQTYEELMGRAPTRYSRWLRDPYSVTPPRGETLHHLAKRVRSMVGALARRHANQTLALVTHGGPIRILLCTDPKDFWSVHVPPACSFLSTWPPSEGVAS